MEIYIIQFIALLVYVHGWFVFAAIKKRNDVADIFWGTGFVLVALIGLMLNPNLKTLIVGAMVTFGVYG